MKTMYEIVQVRNSNLYSGRQRNIHWKIKMLQAQKTSKAKFFRHANMLSDNAFSREMFQLVASLVILNLKSNHPVEIPYLGTFSLKCSSKFRENPNDLCKEDIKIKIAFLPSADLKRELSEKELYLSETPTSKRNRK